MPQEYRFKGKEIFVKQYEDNAARAFGIIRANLESQGQPIEPYVLLIAAHAYSLGLILVTNNIKEIKRIKN